MDRLPNCYRCGKQPCECKEPRGTLYHGDVLDVLRLLPTGIVQCVVTSPPYFALRSYLAKDDPLKAKEIGSEPTPEAFIQTMVEVFREVKRVLRDDGVCFVNLGDGYDQGKKGAAGGCDAKQPVARRFGIRATENGGGGLGNGQLLNIPHRVAEALRADGWVWRQTIVWAKRSPMPESVSGWRWVRCRVKVGDKPKTTTQWNQGKGQSIHCEPEWSPCPGCPKCESHGGYVLRRGAGRCTTAHEYVFVFAKSGKYFWDGEASKERGGTQKARPFEGTASNRKNGDRSDYAYAGDNGQRNPRSVWTLSSEPTSERHFATFPSELVRRCLVAGCSAGGCCLTCGAPWAPVVDSERVPTRPAVNNKIWKHDDGDKIGQRSEASPNLDPERHIAITSCQGYRQTCDCPPHEPGAQLVLDPFCGLATVGQTALHLGHRFIGIDLNAKYLDVAAKRITQTPRWKLRKLVATGKTPKKTATTTFKQEVLF